MSRYEANMAYQNPTYFSASEVMMSAGPSMAISILTNHGDLTNKCSNIDQKVVTHVDAGVGDSWIHNDALSAGFGTNVSSRVARLVPVTKLACWRSRAGSNRSLFGNKWRDASLEKADTASKQDQTKDERRKGSLWRSNNLRNRGDKDEDVSKGSHDNRNVNRLELAPVLVG
jgi:hypothetical protein